VFQLETSLTAAILQMSHKTKIARRQWQACNLRYGSPPDLDVFARDGLAQDGDRCEEDHERRAVIATFELCCPNLGHDDPEFFVELSYQSRFFGFARFAFAAGELPQTTVPLVMGPLAYQEFVPVIRPRPQKSGSRACQRRLST
jgi:hypothetical protein